MSAPIFRTGFRSCTLVSVLFAVTMLNVLTDTALADRVVLTGTYSASDIKASCNSNGGTFATDGAAYGCSTKKGSVTCNWDGQCIGNCKSCGPAVTRGNRTIFGVLSGATLKVGANTQTVRAAES